MKLIPQEIVDTAAKETYDKNFKPYREEIGRIEIINMFELGVEFAEKKFPQIAIDFAEWILSNKFEEFGRNFSSPRELFFEFMDDRNG